MIKIYCYTNLKDNNKKYIGQTSLETLEERAGSNFINYKESWKFYNAIQKFGPESFSKEILYEVETKDEANLLEISLIEKFQTQNDTYGYNIQPGGNQFIMTNTIKERISAAVKKSKKFKENNFKSHAKSVVAISIKNKNFMVFDSLTDASEKLNLSRGTIGCICNKKGRALSLKNYIFRFEKDFLKSDIENYINEYLERKKNQYSEIRNKKMAESLKEKVISGDINFDYMKKRVICIETNIIYNSLKEAGDATNTCYQNISAVCQGKRKTANKYHWKYL